MFICEHACPIENEIVVEAKYRVEALQELGKRAETGLDITVLWMNESYCLHQGLAHLAVSGERIGLRHAESLVQAVGMTEHLENILKVSGTEVIENCLDSICNEMFGPRHSKEVLVVEAAIHFDARTVPKEEAVTERSLDVGPVLEPRGWHRVLSGGDERIDRGLAQLCIVW